MIETKDVLSIGFIKKLPFAGSHKGMRYRLSRKETDDGMMLEAILWPEPFCFDATDDELKKSRLFSFDEEGRLAAIDWLNSCYSEREEYYISCINRL